mgnify:CR=1 FL=1
MQSDTAMEGDTLRARLKEMMAMHPGAPVAQHGRLTWLRNELENVAGVKVSLETVRKWAADEAVPRQSKMSGLAKALDVDEAWLSLGRKPTLTTREERREVRSAQSATLYVAGLLGLSGVNVAFADEHDQTGTHLHAISADCHLRVSVAIAEQSGLAITVRLEGAPDGQVVVAVLPAERDTFAIYDVTQAEFELKGGYSVAVFTLEGSALIQHKTHIGCPRLTSLSKVHKFGK